MSLVEGDRELDLVEREGVGSVGWSEEVVSGGGERVRFGGGD